MKRAARAHDLYLSYTIPVLTYALFFVFGVLLTRAFSNVSNIGRIAPRGLARAAISLLIMWALMSPLTFRAFLVLDETYHQDNIKTCESAARPAAP